MTPALGFEPKRSEILRMIQDVDPTAPPGEDGSGTVEFPVFMAMMSQKIVTRDEMLKTFRLFDDDETGKLSFKNLKRVAQELGVRMTDEELQEMFNKADRDGDGEVTKEDFLRVMRKAILS